MDAPKKPKQQRNADASKARILEAAKQCFSENGYAATGIRDVAAMAGVSYALLGKYFGSKSGLLEAALASTMNISPIIRVERSQFGANLARQIIASLRNEAPISMTILAAADPTAKPVAAEAVSTRVIAPLAEWLGEPHAETRAAAITMAAAGFVIFTQHLPVTAVPDSPDHPLARWLADSFQRIVDGEDLWTVQHP